MIDMSNYILYSCSCQPYEESDMSKNSLHETLHQLMHTYTNLLLEGIRRQELDLSVMHIRTLKGVCHNPEVTAKSIAKRMERDKAQITRALNDLLAADLIT